MAVKSVMLSLTRQIFCLIPFFYLFSLIGLSYTWLAFPVSEVIAGSIGLYLYIREYEKQKKVPKEIQKKCRQRIDFSYVKWYIMQINA